MVAPAEFLVFRSVLCLVHFPCYHHGTLSWSVGCRTNTIDSALTLYLLSDGHCVAHCSVYGPVEYLLQELGTYPITDDT